MAETFARVVKVSTNSGLLYHSDQPGVGLVDDIRQSPDTIAAFRHIWEQQYA